MATIIPHGEALHRAVRWISEQRKEHADRPALDLVEEACFRFDLSPAEEEWMIRTFASAPPSVSGPQA